MRARAKVACFPSHLVDIRLKVAYGKGKRHWGRKGATQARIAAVPASTVDGGTEVVVVVVEVLVDVVDDVVVGATPGMVTGGTVGVVGSGALARLAACPAWIPSAARTPLPGGRTIR